MLKWVLVKFKSRYCNKFALLHVGAIRICSLSEFWNLLRIGQRNVIPELTVIMSCKFYANRFKGFAADYETVQRGTQREYSSKPLKHSIVKRILVDMGIFLSPTNFSSVRIL